MKKVIYFIIIVLTAGYFSSCKDMDSTYQEFLVPNGLTYPQKPDSLKIHAGYNELRLTWLKSTDPSVVRAEIYWNNYLDTIKVDDLGNRDTVSVNIPVNDENTYTFHVRTFDADNNASIPVEVSGAAYGNNYILGTTDRTIASALLDDNYTGTIIWNGKTTDLVYSEVRYTTRSGEKRIVRVLPDEILLKCPDAKSGEVFEYRSAFLPPNGISIVEKDWIPYEEVSFLYKYPRNIWTAESRGGNHSWIPDGDGGTGKGGQPVCILDGNLSSGWHSNLSQELPQCLVIDMKQSLPVHDIILSPHTTYCYFNDIEVYFSNTPITPDVPQPSWGEPIVKLKYPGPGSSKWTIDFPSVPSAQYIALVFINSTSTAGNFMNLMEFEVIGY